MLDFDVVVFRLLPGIDLCDVSEESVNQDRLWLFISEDPYSVPLNQPGRFCFIVQVFCTCPASEEENTTCSLQKCRL